MSIMTDNGYSPFLQLAIGNGTSLSCTPTNEDWCKFYLFCKKQAMLGVGFAAVEKLHGQGVECPKELRIKWMAAALKIETLNKKLNAQSCGLTKLLEHDGLHCCILKGQGNLLNYPEHLKLRRNPGDIDIWCVAPAEGLPIAVQADKDRAEYAIYHGRKAVKEYVLMQHRLAENEGKPIIRYHHIEAPDVDGTPIEVHFRVGHVNSPLRNMRMQRWFDGQAGVCMKNRTHLGFSVPAPSVNVVYQMTHLFTHYFDEGLGLRQLMDYYFTLKVWSDNYELRIRNYDLSAQADEKLLNYELSQSGIRSSQGMWAEGLGVSVMSKEEVMNVLHSFGMEKFAAAVMWVLHEVFAMPTHYYICEPNEKEGRKLFAEIMQGGNFGHYDERGKKLRNGGTIPHAVWKLKRVMRLASSYPEEALCEPFFRVWHWGWRCLH